jgi:hypothetical protein
MSVIRNDETNPQDQETLRRHREMYERRLRDIERADGKSDRELVNTANNPSVFKAPGRSKTSAE